jgi:hypothetical protein
MLSIVILIILLYVYSMQWHICSANGKIFVSDLIASNTLKTGDLILFKACNNWNSVMHGGYFGHVGVVCMRNGIPYLFEANGIDSMPLLPIHNTRGIFCTPLYNRVSKYKGRVYYRKSLITPINLDKFEEFIQYAICNFYYDKNIVESAFSKKLGLSACNKNTDCGQLAFLSLIILGIIDAKEYNSNIFHHLNYVTSLPQYEERIEVVDIPFDR